MVRISKPRKPDREIRSVEPSKETAGYDEYVRWCGRTGAERPPPTRLPLHPERKVWEKNTRISKIRFSGGGEGRALLRQTRIRPVLRAAAKNRLKKSKYSFPTAIRGC